MVCLTDSGLTGNGTRKTVLRPNPYYTTGKNKLHHNSQMSLGIHLNM